MRKMALILFSQFLIFALHAQHAKPIISDVSDSLSFYDRLNGINLNKTNKDSSFNWLIGEWKIQAKGYAQRGFRGKKYFEWTEAPIEFMCDENHAVFAVTKDSSVFTKKNETVKAPKPPQVVLQYDVNGKVWVMQPGYNDRYDWGSLVSNGWQDNKIIFIGTISLAGIQYTERQTWTKLSNDQFHILYQQKMKTNSWFTTEENTYTRIK